MVGTSKILTVSYGTFSCTLEGFDDSFNTMKAIAEYFRDLASDDRYFGAEPPTPDAEMLARIAEREISRRVDARTDESGIVLRAAALSDQSDVADDDAAPAPVHDDASRAKVEADRKAAKAARKEQKAAAKAKAKAEAKAAKAAEKAQEAEKAKAAAKAQADAKAEAEAKADADAKAEAKAAVEAKERADAKAKALDDAKAMEDARDQDAAASEDSLLKSVSAATAAKSEGTTGSAVEETRDDAPSSMLAATDPAPEKTAARDAAVAPGAAAAPAVAVPAHPDADSVAAKLQRIRAVVGKSDVPENTPSADLSAQFLPRTDAPDIADADTGTADDLVADFDAHEAELAQDAEPDDMISRVMAREAAKADDAQSEPETPETEIVEDVQSEDNVARSDDTQPRARIVRMKRADFEKAVADQKAGGAAKPDAPTGPDFGLLDGADELDDYLEDSDFTEDMALMDDVDLAQDLKAIEDEASGDIEPDDDDNTIDAKAAGTMDAVAAAMSSGAQDAEDEDDYDDEVAEHSTPDRAARTVPAVDGEQIQTPQFDDAALDRLMDESEAQMQEPEGSRRRDAIAQLKAAVAAKEAARQVGDVDDDDQDVENAFRNDLSKAVQPEGSPAPRPRPVIQSGARTERPRPAPLKLVAAQRVDLDSGEQRRDTPVVPRRVSAQKPDPNAPRASGSFAEFADNMGASNLPDLLEAAAAYTSFVEGADEFSRPQILRRVRAVAADDFKREDELRSFAELISAGRFTKVRNGRFQVADDSRFNPERRAG